MMESSEGRILVMTSVEAERDAVLRGIDFNKRVDVVLAGVGPVSAAIETTKALQKEEYSLVICAGIAGGFTDKADVGSVVVASEIVSADLGAESPDGFIPLDDLGFGSSTRIAVEEHLAGALTSALEATGIITNRGTVLTLSTVTGTAETTADLQAREPDAVAEAMEGYGVASAARSYNVPVLELRAISNAIGPRVRSAWRIKDALAALESASKVITEVF
ncbi:futalosine hydrolase [Fictibacillus aquaticus]|uniref:Futalosine hydrolase n=1 Tax=Fictibacillus aquaticus TaxID=2021314 RepID=A0A235F669_9BACL|nr:futalosine hydrolase [Fictibacillus aquaticus]OYD56644.1 futalosine hydrolase [Fictibacillus aquaticus]